jgi:HlyD family secretion protein
VDALPNKTFNGKVSFISPYGATSGSVIKFTVLIELDPTSATLRGGLSSTATIHIASSAGALLVPVSAVVTVGKNSFVMIPGAEGVPPERRPVTVGIKNLEYAEILSGLKEGEKVLIVGATNSNLRIPNAGGGNPLRALR